MMMEGLCPLTTAEALRRAVTVAPDIEAIVGPDGRLTYAELAAEVAQVRSAVIASGVQKGDHVGICLGNGTRWLVLFLAIGSAGRRHRPRQHAVPHRRIALRPRPVAR